MPTSKRHTSQQHENGSAAVTLQLQLPGQVAFRLGREGLASTPGFDLGSVTIRGQEAAERAGHDLYPSALGRISILHNMHIVS